MINLSTEDWKIENIETVLFDKDGTFIDLHYFWGKMTQMRVQEIIQYFNMPIDCAEKLNLCLGYNSLTAKMLEDGITALYSRSKIIEIFRNDLLNFDVDATIEELEEIFDKVSFEFYKNMEKYTKPIEAAVEFIKKIRSMNLKLGIVTSDSKESTLLTLKHFGWESLFDVVVGRESSSYTKESGELTKIALNQLGANSESTVMIGDAPMDYFSAKNAGVDKVILVATGQINSTELKKVSYYVVDSLSMLDIK